MCTHICINKHVYVYVYIYIVTDLHTYHTYTRTREAPAYIHTYIRAYKHTCIHGTRTRETQGFRQHHNTQELASTFFRALWLPIQSPKRGLRLDYAFDYSSFQQLEKFDSSPHTDTYIWTLGALSGRRSLIGCRLRSKLSKGPA